MKDEINLLPPEVRQAQVRQLYLFQLRRWLATTSGWLVLPLLVIVGAAGVAWQQGAIVRMYGETQVYMRPQVEQQIKEANRVIGAVDEWAGKNNPITPKLPYIFEAVPEGVVLTTLRLGDKGKSLTIFGRFPSREAFLAFQRQLEAIEWIEKVEAPLSNFASGGDNTFSVIVWLAP